MGISYSSNVAKSVAEITNEVLQDTKTESNFVADNDISQSFSNCKVDSLDIDSASKNTMLARQVVKALQNTNVSNQMSQKLVQKATAENADFGIGYASASNVASAMASSSTNISQTMYTAANQVVQTVQNFQCNDSYIGRISIKNTSSNDFLTKQTVEQTQTSSIVNNITQDIDQKATAKNTAFIAWIVILVVLILLFVGGGLSLTKQLKNIGAAAGESDPNASTKRRWTTMAGLFMLSIILFIIVMAVLAALKAPPFFNEPPYTTINESSRKKGCDSQNRLQGKVVSVALKRPPLRYAFPIIGDGGDNSDVSLVVLAIIKFGEGTRKFNGGFNKSVYRAITDDNGKLLRDTTKDAAMKLPSLLFVPIKNGRELLIPTQYIDDDKTSYQKSCVPDVFQCGTRMNCGDSEFLICPTIGLFEDTVELDYASRDADPAQVIALPNIKAWQQYLSSGSLEQRKRKASHARFVLAKILEIDCDVYVNNFDEVFYKDESGKIQEKTAEQAGNNAYRVKGTNWVDENLTGMFGGVDVEGYFETCNDDKQKSITYTSILTISIFSLLVIFFVVSIIMIKVKSSALPKPEKTL
jgi:hypothetical protein